MPAAASELYIKFVEQGVQESSRHLEGFARAAVNADRQFQDLQRTAGTAWARNMAREAGQATAQLERMRRVMAEGRVSVFFSDLTSKIQGMGRAGSVAFGSLALGVGGYIRAGMAGTAESIQLNRALSDINYSVASIFTPQIHKAIDAVQGLAYRLMNLTGAQQASAREWVAGALSLAGFLALLPRVTAGLALLTASGRAARAAGIVQATAAATAGPGAAGAALAGQVRGGMGLVRGIAGTAGILALIGASEEGRTALLELAKAAQPLTSLFARLVPVVSGMVTGMAKLLTWLNQNLPGGLGGPIGGALGGAAFGARYGPWGAAGGAALGFAGGGFSAIEAARVKNQTDLQALKVKLAEMDEAINKGRGGFNPFGGAAAGGVNLAAQRDEIARRIKELEAGKAKDTLTPFTPGFERPEDLYRRIAEAASGQRGPAETTAENTTTIAQAMQAIIDAMRAAGVKIPLDRPGEE